jgi:ABC-type uncharacterized transport system permease subunit
MGVLRLNEQSTLVVQPDLTHMPLEHLMLAPHWESVEQETQIPAEQTGFAALGHWELVAQPVHFPLTQKGVELFI